jgi:hypothetical protein
MKFVPTNQTPAATAHAGMLGAVAPASELIIITAAGILPTGTAATERITEAVSG